MPEPTPEQIQQAHQYLYYVLGRPVWSDYEYDRFCSKHGLECGGGSDLASSYTPEVQKLALSLIVQ